MKAQRRIDNEEGLKLLSREELERFENDGYLIFPEFFNEEWNTVMTKALEELGELRPHSKAIVPHPIFNKLLLNESFLRITRSLLGEAFLFHHANGKSLPPTDMGKIWHHDYDGTVNWKPGKPLMIHLLVYPQGIDGNRGPLAILPKSHLLEVERSEPNVHTLDDMEGEIEVSGKPGLLVILNSALWHSRRLNSTSSRRPYFNYVFCQFGAERPERGEYTQILKDLRDSLKNQKSELVDMLLQINTLKKE